MIYEKADAVFNRQIGRRIRTAREHRKMSLEELAESSSSLGKLERYEAGSVSIPLDELRRIAIVLDVPTYYFLGDGELLHWFDERKFINTYRILKPKARQTVQNLVFSIASDHPVTHQ